MAERENVIEKNSTETSFSVLSVFSRLWIWLFGGMFDKVKFFKKNARTIEKYASQGVVIHVFQYASYLEYLILNYFLRKHGLETVRYPEETWLSKLVSRFVCFVSGNQYQPMVSLGENEPLSKGQQGVLFLQKKGSFLSVKAERQKNDIAELIELQKTSEVPIFLMPQITIWSRYPVSMIKNLSDVFFGNSLHPGRIRKFLIFLKNHSHAFMRSGEPISLENWTSDEFEKHGKSPVKEIRWRLFKFFSEERMSAMGPMTRPRTWLLESVLELDEVREVIAKTAKEQDKTIEEVRNLAARELDFLAADYKYSFIVMMSMFLRKTLGKIYNPLVMDKEGINRVRELLKQQAVVYVPSHKSHVDYLAWSWMLNESNIYPPHIIAGENLSFWPMGFLFRRMGAIFIKRTFKGNPLYTTLVRRYLTHMLWEGYSQEFFIEGTRSRTGKLLSPKYGILSFYLDSFLKNPDRDLTFVPISMTYNKLLEESAHSRELTGGEKVKENTSSLLKLTKLFKLRYGALYVNVGEPISMKDYFADHGVDPLDIKGKSRAEIIAKVGHEIIYRINDATMVTASSVVSLALLTSGRKGVSEKKLYDTVDQAIMFLKESGARLSDSFDNPLLAVSETLEIMKKDGSIQSHNIGNETIYTIADNKRHALDYYKNYILHFFAPASYLAIAFSSFQNSVVKKRDVMKRAAFLSDLFELELPKPPAKELETMFSDAVDHFVKHGVFTEDENDNLCATENTESSLPMYRNLFSNFLESYWLAAASLPKLKGKKTTEKKFLKFLLEEGKKLSLIGDLEHSEATSKLNFQNAIKYFIKHGIIVQSEVYEETSITRISKNLMQSKKTRKKIQKRRVKLELAEDFESDTVLREVEQVIKFYLN